MFERIRTSRPTLAAVLSVVALFVLVSPVGAAVESTSQPVASHDLSTRGYGRVCEQRGSCHRGSSLDDGTEVWVHPNATEHLAERVLDAGATGPVTT